VPGQTGELLEREEALTAIAGALAGAAGGKGGVLFLVGDPGIGKTTMLDECCRRGVALGFRVKRASCSELEQVFPFGMLDRLFDGIGAPPPPAGPTSSEARLARYTQLLGFLRQPARKALLLAVDDLHWADIDSVEMLGLICRRLPGLAVAVCGTARPWPSIAVDQARSLAHDRFAALLRLQPLSEQGSAALLTGLLGDDLAKRMEHEIHEMHEQCAGNPLLLSEMAGALARGNEPAPPAGRLGERIFLPRFAGVGGPAMRWAQAASVLGTRFRLALANQLSGLASGPAAQAVEALLTSGILRELPQGSAEFVHPLVRQAIYEDLSPVARQQLHALAFRVLADQGASPTEAAPHALSAELRGDRKAVAVLVAAGRLALAAGAIGTAAGHFQAAATLAGSFAEPRLRLDLAEACLTTGKLDLADQILREFLTEGLAPADLVAVIRLQARLFMAQGHYNDAKRRFREASQMAAGPDPALAAEALLDGASLGFLFEGQREALAGVREALDMLGAPYEARPLHPAGAGRRPARRLHVVGAPLSAVTGKVLHAHTYLSCVGGDFSELDSLARAAKASLDAGGQRSPWNWDAASGYANMAKAAERLMEAQGLFAALLEEADRQGAVLTFQSLAIGQADTLWRLGRLDEATQLLVRATDVADLAPGRAPFAWVGLAHLRHEQGDLSASQMWAEKVEAVLEKIGDSPYLRMWLSLLRCRDLLKAGEAELAARAGTVAAATAERSGILEPCLVPWHGAAIEAEVAAGHLDEAEALAVRLDEVNGPLPCRAPRAVAATGRALIAWRRGRLDEARQSFEVALAHNVQVPMPLATAETLISFGRFLRHTGEVREGRTLLRRALSVLEGTGAGRLIGVAQQELAGAGGRHRRSRSPGLLTPREETVAQLAAKGLTNAQIARALYLSEKTVDHHLSRTYAKLGISSRRQLMLAWRASATGAAEPPATASVDGPAPAAAANEGN
jgi:DNA-binding CsgD family transcriptional regulator